MRVGILSDTHGNVAGTAAAAALLKVHGAEIVFHCGDIESEAVLIELADAFGENGIPVHAVLGNVDMWDTAIAAFPAETGIQVHGRFLDMECDGRRFAVVHGHEPGRLASAMNSGRFDYVLTGHTHLREDRKVGGTRVINPGAVHRSPDPGVAILDTAQDTVQFIALRDDVVV